MPATSSFLIIQTAFIGDVILATAVAERLHQEYPQAPIDFLLRKGNESLLFGHPYIRHVLVWDKKGQKLRNLFRIIRKVRSLRYDYVINLHRFTSSGLITVCSGASTTIGFNKNPLSLFFSFSKAHDLSRGLHEVQRNQSLIAEIAGSEAARPRLYPTEPDREAIRQFSHSSGGLIRYVCLAPASVWFTKQFQKEKWIEVIQELIARNFTIYLLGAPGDQALCEAIREATVPAVINTAGTLTFLQSAALMGQAQMNYTNDSAPLHLASSVNAPVTAVFCSTIPGFGFGPLSDTSVVVETREQLSCRPCGLHGYKSCPQGHFKCALTITTEQVVGGNK